MRMRICNITATSCGILNYDFHMDHCSDSLELPREEQWTPEQTSRKTKLKFLVDIQKVTEQSPVSFTLCF